jgi:hypothetical protein
MSRNSIESEIVRSIKTMAETAYMTVSASMGIVLARVTVIDIGRSDFPNAVLEAAGTILGISLATLTGKELVKNITSSFQAKTSPSTN